MKCSYVSEKGDTLLVAAGSGKLKKVRICLQGGADTNYKNKCGTTALILAASKGPVCVIELLLQKGAEVNATNRSGSTALIHASESGHLGAVETLLRKGAAVDTANQNGWTALHYAAENGHKSVIETLLQKGADINAVTKDGRTALGVAIEGAGKEILRSAAAPRVTPAAAAAALQAPEDPACRRMYDGLTPELYTEFQFLKDLPLQHLDEQISRAISCAFKERRMEDVKPLKDQRVALGYVSAGVTAAEMRERLTALLEKIDDRYDCLAEREDEVGCEVCVDCQVMIFDILDLGVPESSPCSMPSEAFDDKCPARIREVDDRDAVDLVAESMRSTVHLSD